MAKSPKTNLTMKAYSGVEFEPLSSLRIHHTALHLGIDILEHSPHLALDAHFPQPFPKTLSEHSVVGLFDVEKTTVGVSFLRRLLSCTASRRMKSWSLVDLPSLNPACSEVGWKKGSWFVDSEKFEPEGCEKSVSATCCGLWWGS